MCASSPAAKAKVSFSLEGLILPAYWAMLAGQRQAVMARGGCLWKRLLPSEGTCVLGACLECGGGRSGSCRQSRVFPSSYPGLEFDKIPVGEVSACVVFLVFPYRREEPPCPSERAKEGLEGQLCSSPTPPTWHLSVVPFQDLFLGPTEQGFSAFLY